MPDDRHDFTNDCCFNCGGSQFEWGMIVIPDAQLTRPQPTFQPDTQPKRSWLAPPLREGMRARKCERCGNVQFFVSAYVSGDTPSDSSDKPADDR